MTRATSTPQRKLAAIMFTDIVGYSRIMSLDESKAFQLLDQHDQILNQKLEEHRGKVLKKMGDAFFVEFASSVDAVNCATNIQESLKEYNLSKDRKDQIIIRIGIHLGDVIIHGDDLFGEGINVAARLEPLAPPGGICMSQAVYQSVSSHTELVAHSMGEIELKNIVEKYTVYTIPSFYVESFQEIPRSGADENVLDFSVKNIQRLPAASNSYWTVVGYMSLFFIACWVIGYFIGNTAPHSIKRGEIYDRLEFIAALQDSSDQGATNIVHQLKPKVRRAITDQEAVGTIPDSVIRVIRRDLNRLIESEALIIPKDVLDSINLSPDIVRRIEKVKEKEDYSKINRLIIGSMFKGKITESPSSEIFYFIEYVIPQIPRIVSESPGLYTFFGLAGLIGILISAFYAGHATIRITFISIKHIDGVLEYFTEQLGFKPPIKEKGHLVYKATLAKIAKDFLWGWPAKIRVRGDGNSIVITSTIQVVRRLEKQFKAYSKSEDKE